MANFSALKTAIQNAIKQNGNEEITGDVLQQILLSIVSTMGDGAINTIEQNLSNEALARQGADNTLQSHIDAEAGARQSADGTLQSNINAEALARGNADTQLQNAINAIKANIDNGYVYAGIATPSSTPVSGKVFYVATAAGTYTNFGGQVLTQGINILRYNGSAWSHQQLIGIDDVPTAGSNSLVKSGGVQNELALGAVYDVSAKNPTAGPNNDGKWESLSALLSDANLNTLIPTAYRKGGMSIKFVHTNDNKYVQYFLTKNTWSVSEGDWQKMNLEEEVEQLKYFEEQVPFEKHPNGGFLDVNSGSVNGNYSLVNATGWYYSDFIAVNKDDVILASFSLVENRYRNNGLCFFETTTPTHGTRWDYDITGNTEGWTNEVRRTIKYIVPANGYISVSSCLDNIDIKKRISKITSTPGDSEDLIMSQKGVTELTSSIITNNIIEYNNWTLGCCFNINGETELASRTTVGVAIIPLENYRGLSILLRYRCGASSTAKSWVEDINGNKRYITSEYANTDIELQIGDNDTFLYLSTLDYPNSYIKLPIIGELKDVINKNTFELYTGLTHIEEQPISILKESPGFGSIIKHWGFIGDSLSSGTIEREIDGVWYSLSNYEYSWCQQLCKLLSVDGYNFSVPSQSAHGFVRGLGPAERRLVGALTNLKDAYIISLGVNDGSSVGSRSDINSGNPELNADTFYGNYSRIIQSIREVNPNCYFFCCTNPKIDDYNDAIRDMANLYERVYIIDLKKENPFFTSYPILDIFFSRSHMNTIGYLWFAYVINTYVDWIIRKNNSDFSLCNFVPVDYLVSGTIQSGITAVGLAKDELWNNLYVGKVSNGNYTIYAPNGTYKVIINSSVTDIEVTIEDANVTLNL